VAVDNLDVTMRVVARGQVWRGRAIAPCSRPSGAARGAIRFAGAMRPTILPA
jgi:hypothetical protein